MRSRPKPRSQGLTLVEVLVALAIVALALAAGTQSSSALLRHAQRQSDQLLAQMCVENELIRWRLIRQAPPVGDSDFACEQAGRQMGGTLRVFPTPNPNFRRVEAQVRSDAQEDAAPVFTLITIMGQM
jgi:general secretion pathway protein I